MSLDINQINYWTIENITEESFVSLDISVSGIYHLSIPQESIEIYWEKGMMWTVYHSQQRIIRENQNIDNILSIFISQDDIDNAKWVKTNKLNDGKEITYQFVDEFSDWTSLKIKLNTIDLPLFIELVDYENNQFSLSFSYRDHYRGFDLDKVKNNVLNYTYLEN